jgi:hypothetical protein
MIKSTELQFEFTRRFNRINSGGKRYISPPVVDSYLNEGQDIFFENRAGVYKTSPLAKEDLRVLEEKQKCFSVKKFDDRSDYIVLPKNFYKILRVEAKISCPTCPTISAKVHEIINHDLAEALIDPNWKPSYNYAETFYEIAGDELIIYHNGEFKIEEVCIDYLRKPNKIYTPSLTPDKSYVSASGELISSDSDCELNQGRKIVDIAVLIASRDLTDVPEYEMQLQKILHLEKVYSNDGGASK